MARPAVAGPETRVLAEIVAAENPGERRPLVIGADGDGAPAVLALAPVQTGRRIVGAERHVAPGAERPAADLVVEYGGRGQRHRRLHLAEIDHGTVAGGLTIVQRGQDGHGPEITRRIVRVRVAEAGLLSSGPPGHAMDTADGLHDGSEDEVVLVRAAEAEARHPQVDKSRADRVHGLPRQAPGLQHVRAHVRDDDAAAGDEIQGHADRLGMAHVQRDAALIAVEVVPQPALFPRPRIGARRLTPVAHAVGIVRPLNLDHLSTEVGQDLGALRARDHPGEVEDADALKRQTRHVTGPCSGAPAARSRPALLPCCPPGPRGTSGTPAPS